MFTHRLLFGKFCAKANLPLIAFYFIFGILNFFWLPVKVNFSPRLNPMYIVYSIWLVYPFIENWH